MELPKFVPMRPKEPKGPEYASRFLGLCKDNDWVLECKYDGVRCMMHYQNGEVRLLCQRESYFSGLSEVEARVKKVVDLTNVGSLVLDCELVSFGSNNLPDYDLLLNGQGRRSLVVFDLLYAGEQDFSSVRFMQRKFTLSEIYEKLLLTGGREILRLAEAYWGAEAKLEAYVKVRRERREGVLFKHKKSVYNDTVLPWWKIVNPDYKGVLRQRALNFVRLTKQRP
ncbi:MAG: hypothetical protein JNN11_00975 [Candidatus Doudnabacteria bacterium]|nr:hypothetical protein [Candidatus Doudnabacteria bacterium]